MRLTWGIIGAPIPERSASPEDPLPSGVPLPYPALVASPLTPTPNGVAMVIAAGTLCPIPDTAPISLEAWLNQIAILAVFDSPVLANGADAALPPMY